MSLIIHFQHWGQTSKPEPSPQKIRNFSILIDKLPIYPVPTSLPVCDENQKVNEGKLTERGLLKSHFQSLFVGSIVSFKVCEVCGMYIWQQGGMSNQIPDADPTNRLAHLQQIDPDDTSSNLLMFQLNALAVLRVKVRLVLQCSYYS